MSRLARLYVPGLPQLVLQRGTQGALIFHDDADYLSFQLMLRDAAREQAVAVHAYVLMPNHFHILLSAPEGEATGQMMQKLGRRYVRYFNNRYSRSGTLWAGRYRSTVLEPHAWLLKAYLYLEMNPVRSGLVAEAQHYLWSSCRHHVGLVADNWLSDHAFFWALGNTPFDRQASYRALLATDLGSASLAALRYAAHHGWMLGEPDLASQAGSNRRIHSLPRGRPKKIAV